MTNDQLGKKILDLKKKFQAIILAHNYQTGDIQDLADYVGDSLGLSQQAAKTDAKVIIFCGVHFMAETAAILCPDKIVIMPDIRAGCPMANMITAQHLRKEKEKYPAAAVVCYINTNAEVKAESDYCVTSGNAVKVVENIAEEEILFVPDQYLGYWVSTQIKKKKKFYFWDGYCRIHVKILPEYIMRLKEKYPQAEVIVHPECTPAVTCLANKVLGTGGMLKYVKESSAPEFIVGTEIGLIHRLKKENPEKEFYPAAPHILCPNMKLTTMEKILWCLENPDQIQFPAAKVTVPAEIRLRAKRAIDRMLALV